MLRPIDLPRRLLSAKDHAAPNLGCGLRYRGKLRHCCLHTTCRRSRNKFGVSFSLCQTLCRSCLIQLGSTNAGWRSRAGLQPSPRLACGRSPLGYSNLAECHLPPIASARSTHGLWPLPRHALRTVRLVTRMQCLLLPPSVRDRCRQCLPELPSSHGGRPSAHGR